MSHRKISIRIIEEPIKGYGITLPIHDPFYLPFSPITIVFQQDPRGEDKATRYPVNDAWMNYIASINTADAFRWLTNLQNMYFNDPNNPRLAESIMSLNYFSYDAEDESHVRLIAYDHNADPSFLDKNKNRHWDDPTRWSKATASNAAGDIINVGNGYDAYWPIMGHVPVWLNKQFCFLFPKGRNYIFKEGHKIYDGNQLLFEYKDGQRHMPDPTWQCNFKTFVPALEAYP